MPFGVKNCLQCNKEIVLKIRRDLGRKKYCNRSCRQLYRYATDIKFQQMFEKARKLSLTPEANSKKSMPGEKNPRYIKDRNKLKTRKRYENTIWRKAVFERDNYTCQICHKKGGQLQADHIQPYCAFPELRTDINNGRTLCVNCHKKTDTYGSKALNFKEVPIAV